MAASSFQVTHLHFGRAVRWCHRGSAPQLLRDDWLVRFPSEKQPWAGRRDWQAAPTNSGTRLATLALSCCAELIDSRRVCRDRRWPFTITCLVSREVSLSIMHAAGEVASHCIWSLCFLSRLYWYLCFCQRTFERRPLLILTTHHLLGSCLTPAMVHNRRIYMHHKN